MKKLIVSIIMSIIVLCNERKENKAILFYSKNLILF
jgi:hypothetical protein